jgi:hypothetical protein
MALGDLWYLDVMWFRINSKHLLNNQLYKTKLIHPLRKYYAPLYQALLLTCCQTTGKKKKKKKKIWQCKYLNFTDRFSKNPNKSNITKIHPIRSRYVPCSRKDRYDGDSSRFSYFFEKSLKLNAKFPSFFRSEKFKYEIKISYKEPTRYNRQPKTYLKPEAAIIVFGLLMMSGVSHETCWEIKKHWNNKFYYTVASYCSFLWNLYYDARIYKNQPNKKSLRKLHFKNSPMPVKIYLTTLSVAQITQRQRYMNKWMIIEKLDDVDREKRGRDTFHFHHKYHIK